MAERVVVDCSQPFTGDVERAVTVAELGLEGMAAAFAGDLDTAQEKLEAALEAAALPTVNETLKTLSATPFEA